jgi:hypothetical protein
VSAPIEALGRQVRNIVAGVHESKLILAHAADPTRPAFRHIHLGIARDQRRIASVLRKLRRAYEDADGDLLLRIELAEQLTFATAAEAALRSAQVPAVRP